jgi:uncharacterized protein YndB with AHSA1/START domain
MAKPTYVYVTYIRTTADKVWQALTDGEITRRYWGGQQNVSKDWQAGSEWRHVVADDPSLVYGVGTVVESVRPRRLVVTWAAPDDAGDPATYDRVTYDIAEDQGVVRLTVTNENVEPSSDAAQTWPKILSGLKSLLETGEPLPPFWDRTSGEFRAVRFA